MIPDSSLTRRLIFMFAVAQTAIAPLSILYYTVFFITKYKLNTLLHYWLGCEILFYIFFKVTINRMQRIMPVNKPTPKERHDLYYLCLNNIESPESWLSEWFIIKNKHDVHPNFYEIYRDNVAEWLAWAFFGSSLDQVTKDANSMKELDYMIDHFEDEFHIQFKSGYNENVVAYRINLDPVHAYHRPLGFYAVIRCLTFLFNIACRWYFRMKKYSHKSHKVAYWYRDGDRNKKPVVFIHGIGAGVMCYIMFLSKILLLNSPAFFIELPHVSMLCREDVPTMKETVDDIQYMLHHHGFKDAVFIAHSLGTAVAAWLVKYIPKSVSGVIFLDPICFMLHYKDVCSNFVYRAPKTAAQALVKYFASSELYISFYISRHFHWYQTALFVEPTVTHHPFNRSIRMPKNTKVYLSEKDNIVDSKRVDTYLNHHGIDTTVMKNLDHAGFLIYPSWRNQIIQTIQEYIS